ncbi:MAG: TIR domain-containing protein [Henriciella sp.]
MSETDENDHQNGRFTTVFFSYSRVDQSKAISIIREIENAGFSVWWDGVLKGGVKYVESTGEALESAKAVVVMWSKDSIKSNWVLDEAMNGRERACLVPISLDGSVPPLGFRQFQVIDLSGWKEGQKTPALSNLLSTVAELHDQQLDPAQHLPIPVERKLSRRTLLLTAGAVTVLGGAITATTILSNRSSIAKNSIAVLPFENDSRDAEQSYLPSGISAELRNSLARNPGLRVVARSSSEAIQEQKLDARRASRELGVYFIVEGSVRVVGPVVRVSSFLIDGRSGEVRWSETYQQSLDDLLDIQAKLTSAISSELSLAVSTVMGEANIGAATNPAAFDSYLRGWTIYRSSHSAETDLQALARFDNAIRLDPNFAAAHAAQSATLTVLGNFSEDPEKAKTYKSKAYQAALKAVQLGPDLDEAHSVLALTLFDSQLKIKDANAPFQRSLELGAGSAVTQARYAEYAALTGQRQSAREAIDFALELDPLNSNFHRSSGLVHYVSGEFEKAIQANQDALSLEPSLSDSHAWIGFAHIQMENYDAAIKASLKEPAAFLKYPCLAVAHHLAGRTIEAKSAMDTLMEEQGSTALYQQAQVYAQWNELDAAMNALNEARTAVDAGLTYLYTDPLLQPLHDREDYKALQRALGFN